MSKVRFYINSGGFVGNLEGTASWAREALHAPLEPHDHDDRYYIKATVDQKLTGKAAFSHSHDDAYITGSWKSSASSQFSGTASYALVAQSVISSGSLVVDTASFALNAEMKDSVCRTYVSGGEFIIDFID